MWTVLQPLGYYEVNYWTAAHLIVPQGLPLQGAVGFLDFRKCLCCSYLSFCLPFPCSPHQVFLIAIILYQNVTLGIGNFFLCWRDKRTVICRLCLAGITSPRAKPAFCQMATQGFWRSQTQRQVPKRKIGIHFSWHLCQQAAEAHSSLSSQDMEDKESRLGMTKAWDQQSC